MAAFGLLLAAGCGNEEGSHTTGGADAPPPIRVWAHQGQERENAAMRGIVEAFNLAHADEGLRIEITFFPDRQYADKVSIASASGSLPDVIEVDGPYVGPWAAENILAPIDGLVSEDLERDLLPSLIEQGTFRGRLYALGAFESALVLYYNRAMLEAAGVEAPSSVADAWDWEEFLAALESVRPHCALPLSLHMDEQSAEWFTYAFAPLVWSNGGRLIDSEAGRCEGVMDGPLSVEAVSHWQQLFQRGLAEPSSTTPDPFGTGLTAFDWTGHWMLPGFEAREGLDFGVAPLPKLGERLVCPSGSWCWGLTQKGAARPGAWKAIQWFLDPEQGIHPIVKANGAVPGRRSAFVLFPEYREMPRRLFREQLEAAAHPRPRTPVYLTLTTQFARALQDVAGGADPARALGEAAAQVQRALDRQTADGH